jgi:hypothetical protein
VIDLSATRRLIAKQDALAAISGSGEVERNIGHENDRIPNPVIAIDTLPFRLVVG